MALILALTALFGNIGSESSPDRQVTACGVSFALPSDEAVAEYFREAASLWQTQVPTSGPAHTVEGEMLRSVEKLRHEAKNNGNGNWGADHEGYLSYLSVQLDDPIAFNSDERKKNLEVLSAIADPREPCLDDAPYDYLANRVVDYLRTHGSMPRVDDAPGK